MTSAASINYHQEKETERVIERDRGEIVREREGSRGSERGGAREDKYDYT